MNAITPLQAIGAVLGGEDLEVDVSAEGRCFFDDHPVTGPNWCSWAMISARF